MSGDIPVLHVEGETLAEGYERALLALHENGARMSTQYDREGDPPSLDATLNLTVREPLKDPMIHRAFPGGIEALREYVMELAGAKDHWVRNLNDPEDTRWEYTYHQRLASYGTWRECREGRSEEAGPFRVDQIEQVVAKLAAEPHTRQAQMITWMPHIDADCYDPPCLQSLWYRLTGEGDRRRLNCNVRFRSNDAWGANFMNMFGFTMFNRDVIAAGLTERTGWTVDLGRLNWQADSYHIYGKDVADAEARLFRRIGTTEFEDRVYSLADETIAELYDEAETAVREKIRRHDEDH
ncbi:thymidylate synthase [Kiritimatiella glycovorans]|uniref:Thymidylate synthase n=1 Tax=Kiritimatiella glycovorans TaxID=1307763 RepID=A0A0G3ECR3_9BACT|nr:thymidylate synthase [Kiritimatiella glycovorans]AKJ64093.1 thymidylate synthase [Kiritimatiella glycovorans]